MINKRKRGYFRVSNELIENSPNAVKLILSEMLVVRAEALYAIDSIEYTALSDLFEECDEASVTPRYFIELCGKGNVTATRIAP